MATVVRHELLGCDGFRLESPKGLVGWVEETWLGPGDDPAAFAIRTTDGREALLLAEDVARVSAESELVQMRAGARLLELDVPRLQTSPSNGPTASWRTTGNVLEPDAIELWQHRDDRLHERVKYTRSRDGWRAELLSP